jgi:hypothetical protein
MFTKLLIAASTLVLIAYGMEPDKYGPPHAGAQQHAAVSQISINSMTAVPYRA